MRIGSENISFYLNEGVCKMLNQWMRWIGLGAVGAAASLAGCGSGGSSDPTDNTVSTNTLTAEQVQGIWRGSLSADEVNTVILPDGQAWAVVTHTDGSRELWQSDKLQPAGSTLQGDGKRYTFSLTSNSVAVSNFGLTVTAATPKTSVTASTNSGTQNWPLSLTIYDTRYDTPANFNEWIGNWQTQNGTAKVTWTVSGTEVGQRSLTGVGSGTGQDDCTYNGTLRTRNENKAVLDVNLTQTCSSVNIVFKGIGIMSSSTRASLTLVTQDAQSAALLALTR